MTMQAYTKLVTLGLLALGANCSFLVGSNNGGTGNKLLGNANSMDTLLMTAKILSTAGTIQQTIQKEEQNKTEHVGDSRGPSSTNSDSHGAGIIQCNIDKDGLCCLMPNYCSKEAVCKSDIVGQQTYIDYLNAFPRCQCLPGYTGDGRTKGTGCQNVNECLTGEANCEQLCTDYSPGYACGCNPGFRLNIKDMKTCIDVDECLEGAHNCSHTCVNTRGSFFCECPSGYSLDKNNKDCVDIDECKENSGLGPCEFGCRNLPGGFECVCPKGFRLDKKSQKCIDIDECRENKDVCRGFGEVCVNTNGGFECKCGSGYLYDDSKEVCRDIDECSSNTHDCSDDSVCINQDGGFSCQCLKRGFAYNRKRKVCEDIDECSTGEAACDQICVNTLGSYRCECYKGFRLNQTDFGNGEMRAIPRFCVDIDECLETPELTGCSHGCINKRGGFQCACPRGFNLKEDGRSCEDVDECRLPENPCEGNKQFPCCRNTIGGFTCIEQVSTGEIFRRMECPKTGLSGLKEGSTGVFEGGGNVGIFKRLKGNDASKRFSS
ncbi:EGF-like domain-containing protein [Cryptosporidium felis]|nr:EGF-like domain-containing protein [Cryptosporidium felis]